VGEEYDGAGSAVTFAGDLDDDGDDEIVVAASFHGVVCLFDGLLSPGGHALREGRTCWTQETLNDYAGFGLADLGDTDGDGIADLAVAAPMRSEPESLGGQVYVLSGPHASGTTSLSEAPTSFYGGENELAGMFVTGPGDLGGDGVPDLLVGAPGDERAETGHVYLVDSPFAQGESALAGSRTIIRGGGGAGAGAGDVDGDGLGDLLLGQADHGDVGVAAIFLAPVAEGAHAIEEADAIWLGTAHDMGVGGAVAAAGDLTGDGYDDVVVSGKPEGRGVVWVLAGPMASGSADIDEAFASITGAEDRDGFGEHLDGGADTTGDAVPDVLVGAYLSRGAGEAVGAAYVAAGPISRGNWEIVEVATRTLRGEAKGDEAGRALTMGGDADGDGVADMLVGAHYNDDGGDLAGKAYLLTGL
jgi:hypothetical protein